MKIGWGTGITFLYLGFAAIIIYLVTGSMRQTIDLVSDDYYGEELRYQEIIDAGKNQSELSAPVLIQHNPNAITIVFPGEFSRESISGKISFYAPANAGWDKEMELLTTANKMSIPVSLLQPTTYQVKIRWEVAGKEYYQENTVNLF